MESRTRDLETVSRLRSARMSAVASAQNGALAELLMTSDPFVKSVRVVKVLDVHPRLGKVAGRRLLNELGVGHFTSIGELSSHQVNAISSAVATA